MAENRDPSKIEQEIEHTRESIDSTVEELSQRLAPSHLAEEAKSFVKERAMRGATTIWTRVSENAVPLGLIGGGLVWMMRSERSGNGDWTAYRAGYPSATSDERFGAQVTEEAREMAGRARERAAEVAEHAKQKTTQVTSRARETFERMSDEQPILLGIVSLALGAIVGGLMPMTRREDELLGETRDQVVGAAADAAREAAEQTRDAAQREPHQPQPGQAHS